MTSRLVSFKCWRRAAGWGMFGAIMLCRRTISLGWVLGLSLVLLVAGAVGTVMTIGISSAYRNTEALLRERAGTALNSVSSHLKSHVAPVEAVVTTLQSAFAEGLVGMDRPRELQRFIFGLLGPVPQSSGVLIISANAGVMRFDAAERTVTREDWGNLFPIREALAWGRQADAPRLQPPLFSGAVNRTLITVQVPLRNESRFLGVAVVAVSVEELSGFLARMSADLGQTPFVLFDRDRVLAHPALAGAHPGSVDEPLPRLSDIGDPVLAALWSNDRRSLMPMPRRQAPTGASGFRLEIDDEIHSVVYREEEIADGASWIIGTHVQGSLVDSELQRLLRMGAVSLGVLLLSILAALLLARRLSRPVLRLAQAAQQVERSDFDQFEPLTGSRVRELDIAARAFNSMVEGVRERRRIRELFGRYVAAEVAEVLLTGDGDGKAKRQSITALFTDLTGFTTLSEESEPELVAEQLNAYLAGLCDLVAKHNGIVVDFFGDGIFAIFGAPVTLENHARAALCCARDIARFGEGFETQAVLLGQRWGATRVGINSGHAIVGTFGSGDRMKYGAVGDVVNTAARLQDLNKELGTRVLASCETVEMAAEPAVRRLGVAPIRGRRGEIEVAELLVELDVEIVEPAVAARV